MLQPGDQVPDFALQAGTAQTADQGGAEVTDDVAVNVGGDDDRELHGALHQLVGAVVDDYAVRLDVEILMCDLLEGAL